MASSRPPAADDAEFLRRANLDLVGKIPSVSQVRSVSRQSPIPTSAPNWSIAAREGACATHFANLWRATLLGGAADDQQIRAWPRGWKPGSRSASPPTCPTISWSANCCWPRVPIQPAPQLRPTAWPIPAAFYQAADRQAGATGRQHVARFSRPAGAMCRMSRPSAPALEADRNSGRLPRSSPISTAGEAGEDASRRRANQRRR